MKTLAAIAVVAFSAISFNVLSQNDDKKEKELDKMQESERARSTQGIITDNELKDDRGEVQSNEYRKSKTDSSANQDTEPKGEVIEPNKDQGPERDKDPNESDTTQNRSTPAVIQRTSSESGSPAVLSGNNGTDRDGTNNVQRATPNIAGAREPGSMHLSEKRDAQKNRDTATEKKIRKQESRPDQVRDIEKTDATEVMPPPEQDQQSGVLKENTTSAPATVTTAKEERKAKRKNRRNRRKD